MYSSRIGGWRGCFPLQPELMLWISGIRKAFITHLWGSWRYCEGIQHMLLVPVSNDTTVEICWPSPHYGLRNCLFCLFGQYFINLFVSPPDKFNQNIRTALYSRPKGSMLHFCIDHFAGKVTVFQWVLNHSAFIVSVLPREHQAPSVRALWPGAVSVHVFTGQGLHGPRSILIFWLKISFSSFTEMWNCVCVSFYIVTLCRDKK